MRFIFVQITAFVDDQQPGFVECSLSDAHGQVHTFIEKAPVVSRECLWSDSDYPRPGFIACELQTEWTDDAERTLATVSTELPWGIESTEGLQQFVLLRSQLS